MRVLRLACVALLVALLGGPPLEAQMVPLVLQPARAALIVNGTTTTNTVFIGVTTAVSSIDILMNISTTGTATGTLQVWLEDSADGGVTWDDLVSSNTFAFGAAIITQHFFLTGDIATTGTQGAAAAVETLAAGTVRQGPFGDRIRVREKITAIGGSPVGPTYTITAVFK